MTPQVIALCAVDESPSSISALVEQHGWQIQPLPIVRAASDSGRTMWLLGRRAASELYEELNRQPCVVLASKEVYVRSQPQPPLRDRHVLALARFCRYKALVQKVLFDEPTVEWVENFITWMESQGCEGYRDPRCLPLHMFSSSRTPDGSLAQVAGRTTFERQHRNRTGRRDDKGRQWQDSSNALHGREQVVIARCDLPIGFHWDVQPHGTVISGSDAAWRLTGHLNIYPDGFVRKGAQAKLMWSSKDSLREDEMDRTAKSNRAYIEESRRGKGRRSKD